MEMEPLEDGEDEEYEGEQPQVDSGAAEDPDRWEETEDTGDEREPADPEDEDTPAAELEEALGGFADEPPPKAGPAVTPSVAEYPPPPCYVTVGQGDCILSLARRYRRSAEQIWSAPENTELRRRRAHNVLLPGDRVFVPALRLKEVRAGTEERHRFRLRGGTCVLRLKLLRERRPRAHLRYALRIEDRDYEGFTDGNGMLEVRIPADAQRGTLRLLDPAGEEVYPLQLGHLNPIEDTTGVQARLNNLGFACGAVDGDAGPRTQTAVAAFQRVYGLPVTGRADEATRRKLIEVHGS